MTDSHDALTKPGVPRLGLSPATLLAIALGGALGTVARFLLDTTFTEPSGHFPTVTLVINLSGSLAIGFLIPLVEAVAPGRALEFSAGGPPTPPSPWPPSLSYRTAMRPPAWPISPPP
jgi:hypothetical protein